MTTVTAVLQGEQTTWMWCQQSLEECGQDLMPVASVSLSPGMFHQVLYMH